MTNHVMNFFLSHLELFDFILALLALLVAVYSICYTRKCNRPRLFVGNGIIRRDEHNPPLYELTIQNISPVPVSILAVVFSYRGHRLRIIENHQIQYPSDGVYPSWLEEQHMDTPFVLAPYTSFDASYRFRYPDEMDAVGITVYSDQCIGGLKKYAEFLSHFSDH